VLGLISIFRLSLARNPFSQSFQAVSNFTDACNIHRSYAFRIASFLAKLDSWNKVAVFKTATSLEPHWKYDCVPPLRLVDVDGHGQQKCLSPPHISSTVHLCPRACELLLAPSVLHVVRSWTRTNPEFEYGVGVLKDAHQWGLIYQARHPFLAVAIRFVTEKVLTTDISVVNSNVIGYTGPSVLDQAIKFVVCMNPQIQSSMQVLAGNYMNWNIQSKVPGVPEEMIREGSVHY